MGRIADRFRGFLRKAGDKLFHKECAEPVEGHEDEKPATMLDDALSALSVISGKHDSAEETFGKISAQIEGISSSADVMPFAINRNEQRNISMILLSGSAAAMVFTAIGLPYISLIAAMAAAIAAFSVRNIPGNGEKGTNISLSIEPSGPADRTVVFSCHYDKREKKNSHYMKLASPVFPLLSLAAEVVIALLSLSLEILQGILERLCLHQSVQILAHVVDVQNLKNAVIEGQGLEIDLEALSYLAQESLKLVLFLFLSLSIVPVLYHALPSSKNVFCQQGRIPGMHIQGQMCPLRQATR